MGIHIFKLGARGGGANILDRGEQNKGGGSKFVVTIPNVSTSIIICFTVFLCMRRVTSCNSHSLIPRLEENSLLVLQPD